MQPNNTDAEVQTSHVPGIKPEDIAALNSAIGETANKASAIDTQVKELTSSMWEDQLSSLEVQIQETYQAQRKAVKEDDAHSENEALKKLNTLNTKYQKLQEKLTKKEEPEKKTTTEKDPYQREIENAVRKFMNHNPWSNKEHKEYDDSKTQRLIKKLDELMATKTDPYDVLTILNKEAHSMSDKKIEPLNKKKTPSADPVRKIRSTASKNEQEMVRNILQKNKKFGRYLKKRD